MRTTLDITDRLIISAPNDGGLLYAHRHLLMPLLREDATGLAVTAEGLLWCVQTADAPILREIRHGQLNAVALGKEPLDLHDVLVDGKTIYAVFTETNEVVQLDNDYHIQERWHFGEESDSTHVNCIALFEGRLVASMFGPFTTHRGYKGATRGAGKVIDVKTGETLIENLSQPHSLVVVGNQLWLCSSEDRTLQLYERDFKLLRQVFLPAYTRGLAVGETHVYVGLSRSRNLVAGEAGHFSSSVVAVLERTSLDVVGYVPLPWNEIYDIRIASSADLVNEVIISSWAQERNSSEDDTAKRQQQLADIQERLRASEQSIQAERDLGTQMQSELVATRALGESELARLTQMVGAAEAWGRAEVALLTEKLAAAEAWSESERARLNQMVTAAQALGRAEVERLTEKLSADEAFNESERARLNQMVTAAEAFGRSELARLTQILAKTESMTANEKQLLMRQASDDIANMMQQIEAGNHAMRALTQQLEDLKSRVVQVSGEVVKRDARIHQLEQVCSHMEMIKGSRSWRLTRPLRFLARLLRNRGLSDEDRRRLLRRSPAGKTASEPSEVGTSADILQSSVPHTAPRKADVALVDRSDTHRDYFLWAVIDWHFRIQRPQHLARELAAAGHRVFYISNNFIDRSDPGFSVESLDSDGRLFQIHLHLVGSPAIYHATPDAKALEQLRAGVGRLLVWTQSQACASLVQHPYWLETAETLPNHRLIYDCMDHHGGFADNTDDVLEREKELMHDADLLVVTSDWLYDEVGKENPQRMMIRNACQYEHFAEGSAQVFADEQGRKVIGYYGAIAEWFDLELVEKVARCFSDCLVLLVGADTSGAQRTLQGLTNVRFTGEVSYDKLPYYLEGFDVCLLPFQVIPLTLATNPVKVYEYLSAGKDVVSIELPEIRQFGDLVRTGTDHASFIQALDEALTAKPDADAIARRRKFAAEQTWAHRVEDLVRGIDALPEPRVSVVVVTYNNLDLTKACLHSLEAYSDYHNLEVIVVDNASADDTPTFLRDWAAAGDDRQIILNDDNRGFAAANNQGLLAATGEYLVMLNNDTYVTPGWIATLVGHMRRSDTLGMLGPVTNNIGNEARIEIHYATMEEMLQVAGDYTRLHAGQLTSLRTAAFFCVMLSRAVFEKVGLLDEAFGIGFFEDDDYCRRVEQAGWTIACADDVFVHHNLSASFNKLKKEKRQELFERNKMIYEAKWGEWVPHSYRPKS